MTREKRARSIAKTGEIIKGLAFMVMKTDDIIAASRNTYASQQSLDNWSGKKYIDEGLNQTELRLLTDLPQKQGKLLLLGGGGGREAIPLARAGFSVTCVDFVPSMIEKTLAHAKEAGVKIRCQMQDISQLDVPNESYDVAWFSTALYSCIPTRKRRIQMLQRIHQALRPGGCCVCQFYFNEGEEKKDHKWLRRMTALLTNGYKEFEPGDEMIWGWIGFRHEFCSAEILKEEFQAASFDVLGLNLDKSTGEALLKKTS